jgi:alkylation response protein AidB-like acyl-CoA dehydrogenase
VDLELTDDQELFRETTAKFVERTCPLPTVRAWAEKEPAGFPSDWWRQGAELGWTSLLVSEEDGGGSVSGHGLLDLTLVAETMGQWVSPGPLLPVNVVAAALSEFGTGAQRARYLPGLLSGVSIATWCLAEPRHSGLPTGVTLEATKQGGGFVLSGKKGPAEAAAESAFFLVAAMVDGEATQFLVDAGAPGVTVTRAEGIDLVRRFATVSFDQVVLGTEAVLGEVGGAAGQIERLFELATALQCASMVGVTDRVLTFTIEYSFDRYSFGRPLASYQALKHRFADMKMWLEACRATTGAAVTAISARSGDASLSASIAKSYVGEMATEIIQACVQMHGGIGVTWEHDLHVYLRRAALYRSMFGTPEEHNLRVYALQEAGQAPRSA